MKCPTCGSAEIYRSRRDLFERAFNWLFWFHQRPYRCARCMTRCWIRLESRVWRHTYKLRLQKLIRGWGLYIAVILLAAVVAWSLNFLHVKSQNLANPFLEEALKKRLKEQWSGMSAEDKESYRHQARDLNISQEQKQELKKTVGE